MLRFASDIMLALALPALIVFLVLSGLIYVQHTTEATTPDAGPFACWAEDGVYGPETICGNVRLAPPDAHDFADTPGTGRTTLGTPNA